MLGKSMNNNKNFSPKIIILNDKILSKNPYIWGEKFQNLKVNGHYFRPY